MSFVSGLLNAKMQNVEFVSRSLRVQVKPTYQDWRRKLTTLLKRLARASWSSLRRLCPCCYNIFKQILRRGKWLLAILTVALLGFGITASIITTSDELVARCESGNELRMALRQEKSREIYFLKNLPALFPEVPPVFFKEYVDSQVKLIEHNKRTVFAEVDCK